MSEKLPSRNFLTKLSMGIGAILSAPIDGVADSIKKSYQKTMEKNNPIISVKPMGFQWETADPFLFCVHHEDQFPKEMMPWVLTSRLWRAEAWAMILLSKTDIGCTMEKWFLVFLVTHTADLKPLQ